MSTFSELFESHVSKRNISISGLGKYCQFDRANIYKIIHGKRNAPDLRFVEQAASYMKLTPSERLEFIEAWHISEIGEGIYLSRKAIRDFILHFPERIGTLSREGPEQVPGLQYLVQDRLGYRGNASEPAFETYVLVDSKAVNTAAFELITEAFNRKFGTICLLLQPDYNFLFSLLSSVTEEDSRISVEHIICMDTDPSPDRGSDSITCLQLIQDLQRTVPLYQNNLNYQSFYFYDKVQSHYHSLNGLSCMILTETAALLCTSDYRQGLVLHSAEAVKLLHRIFQEYRQSCVNYFLPVSSMDMMFSQETTIEPSEEAAYIFQAEPSLCAYTDAPVLNRLISRQLPNRTEYILALDARMKKQYEAVSCPGFCRYHTLSGIRHFLDTGILLDLPRWLYSPFPPRERIRLTEKMLEHARGRDNSFRLLKEPFAEVSLQMHLYIRSNGGYLLFTGRNNDLICLVIREPSLLEAFRDYFETLGEKELYTQEESIASVQAMLKSYSGQFPDSG